VCTCYKSNLKIVRNFKVMSTGQRLRFGL
jgi:hypothetical protein